MPALSVDGVGAGRGDPGPLLRSASVTYGMAEALARARARQRVTLPPAPVGLAFFGDLHFGDTGVDVDAALSDAELVLQTDGLYVGGVVGDLVNNFVVGRLLSLRLRTGVTVPEEWEMARAYLSLLAPKLIAVVGGNHDAWTAALTGLDYLAELVPEADHRVLYDPHQVDYVLDLGGAEYPGRLRHRWRLKSMYNQTHGIEQAARFGASFRWAVGAHWHEGGVVRSFNLGQEVRLGAVCGTYKRHDEYAREAGFVTQGPKAGVGLLFDPENDSVTGFDDLKTLAKVVSSLRGS